MNISEEFSPSRNDLQFSARKGAVTVFVAVLLVVLLGCAALAVDMGYLYVARTELQRAADAGALAGAQGLGRSADNPFDEFIYIWSIYNQAEAAAEANTCAGVAVSIEKMTDVQIGYLNDPRDLDGTLQTVPLDQCNAVKVTARRTASSPGGALGLFFGPVLGISHSDVSATAIAVIDDRFYAYSPVSVGGVGAIPLSLDEDMWNDQIVAGNGPDEYSYDTDTGGIVAGQDGVHEVKLFPEKLGPSTPDGDDAGAGNFGILHVGSGSLGASTIIAQIREGISRQDFIDLTGEPMIKFYNQVSGEPVVYDAVTYDIEGDPGMKVALKDAMEEKIGQKVGFFVHSNVAGQGSNAVFTVVRMEFGRVMQVDLVGGDKAIVIQPVPHYGPDILTSPYVPSTNRLIGSLELVR